jgi:hypothetical protein
MFELARAYKDAGMTAYCRLQEKEFAREQEYGYGAVKHQRFVGTGYFDAVTQVIAGGTSSVTALTGSTEAEQFGEMKAHAKVKCGPDAACQPILGECPSVIPTEVLHDDVLQPSGD